MKINEIIKERRLISGLTQEELANNLGVSAPAVNKWEKGSSYPDITLLPPLARILGVDLNTLLSFKEDLTDREIALFVNDIAEVAMTIGFKEAFDKTKKLIFEYPTCDKLILSLATILDGCKFILGNEPMEEYELFINELYDKACLSNDLEVKNQAISMTIGRFIENKEFVKAQQLIDSLPNFNFDKKLKQGVLYVQSNELKMGKRVLQEKLMTLITDVSIVLNMLADISIKEGKFEEALSLAKISDDAVELFELWKYNKYTSYLQIYVAQKDEEKTIEAMRNMLESMKVEWKLNETNLYNEINTFGKPEDSGEGFFTAFIANILNGKEFEFLKDNEKFNDLIKEYTK